jgi:hypothetical protein
MRWDILIDFPKHKLKNKNKNKHKHNTNTKTNKPGQGRAHREPTVVLFSRDGVRDAFRNGTPCVAIPLLFLDLQANVLLRDGLKHRFHTVSFIFHAEHERECDQCRL